MSAWIDGFVAAWHRREMRGCRQWADAIGRWSRAQSLERYLLDYCSGRHLFPQGEHVIAWNAGRGHFTVDFDILPAERRSDLDVAEAPDPTQGPEGHG